MKRAKRALTVALLCAVITISPLAQGTQRSPSVDIRSATGAGLTDPQELGAWMDQFLAEYLQNSPASSLGIVLVKGGEIFFQKGYGYADYQKRTPVIPEQTIFYAASVSKLVTATAVMQLIEQGKLNPDADVNTYLRRFRLKDNYPAPVTVASLLTHTSGIDNDFIGMSADRAGDLVSLDDFFTKHPPRRAFAPGEQINYSNGGMAFAGYLVETVSGVPFYDYVEQNVFRPLGMMHSSFRRPIPSHLQPAVATAGIAGNGKTVIQGYPSESLVSTVTDMGHFIIAHLNGGKFGNGRILSEESVREMHRQHFTQHPHMPGVAYGFFESYMNGRRALFHTGGGEHYSLLYLMPDENIGFYLVNSGDEELGKRFLQAFLDRYYPASQRSIFPPPPLDFSQRAGQFTGLYRPNFISRFTIEKLVGFGADTRVVSNGDGTLTLELPPLGSKSLRMVEVEPLLFRTPEGFYVTFSRDANGNVNRMFLSGLITDPTAFDRLRWYQSGLLHLGLGAAGFLVFLSFPVISLVGFFIRRWRKERSKRQPVADKTRLAWRTATLVSVLVILTPVPVLAWMLFGDHSRPSQFRIMFHISSGTLLLAALLGLTLPLFAGIAWKRGYWSITRRVYFSIVALAGLLMIPFSYYWNLLGFRF